MYDYVCMFVYIYALAYAIINRSNLILSLPFFMTRTYACTHTYMYMYIHIYIFVCLFVCMCIQLCIYSHINK